MVGFDLETTSPLPEDARIVSAAIVLCGGGLPTKTLTLLADPGIEIPEEASAVHGISTEMARRDGRPAPIVVAEILAALGPPLRAGLPLVIFNARYDLTVAHREALRHDFPPLVIGHQVIDPTVIDKRLDQYRKSYPYGVSPEQAATRGIASSRTLEGMCVVYGAVLEGAHDAAFDAVAAVRIAYRMGQRGQVIRRARDDEERRELAMLRREWETIRNDLGLLHLAQRRWAIAERARFAEYKRGNGEVEDADRIEAERGWPVLDVMEHEEVAAGG